MTADDARRALIEGLVDYAGLFPPAALGMADAIEQYEEYLRGDHRWALGKFVVSVARLEEFERAVVAVRGISSWRLALVAGADFTADVRTIESFARRNASGARVGAIEVRAATPGQVDSIAANVALMRANIPGDFDVYIEVPLSGDPSPLIRAIGARGLRAKVRTGGVEAGAFPDAAHLAEFIVQCAANGVTFKATAGLHHALRGSYPLTYEPASARGTMFGFLNVFVAALLAGEGLDASTVRAVLEERGAKAFLIDSRGVTWHGHTVSAERVSAMRVHTATSFGSCSFTEPMADLTTLGLLE